MALPAIVKPANGKRALATRPFHLFKCHLVARLDQWQTPPTRSWFPQSSVIDLYDDCNRRFHLIEMRVSAQCQISRSGANRWSGVPDGKTSNPQHDAGLPPDLPALRVFGTLLDLRADAPDCPKSLSKPQPPPRPQPPSDGILPESVLTFWYSRILKDPVGSSGLSNIEISVLRLGVRFPAVTF